MIRQKMMPTLITWGCLKDAVTPAVYPRSAISGKRAEVSAQSHRWYLLDSALPWLDNNDKTDCCVDISYRRCSFSLLHKPTRWRFTRRRVVVYGIDHQWQADLVDLAKLSSYNKGFKYLLTCIDVLSRYAWVVPLKDRGTSRWTIYKTSCKAEKAQTSSDEATEHIVRVGLTTPLEFKKKAPLYADTTVYFIWYTDVPENPWVMLREHWDIREKPQT
jgi:hypothetical protein